MIPDKRVIKADFNRSAKNYHHYSDIQQIVAENVVSIAEDTFEKNSFLLDIGSGTGVIAERIKNVIQVDIAFKMCEIAASHALVVNADMEELPFKNEYVDGIVSSLAIQWSDNEKVLKESYRVMKNGGKFIFSTFGTKTLKELRTILPDRINQFISSEELIRFAENSGFCKVLCKTETITIVYPNIIDLMKKIKGVGGNNKLETRRKKIKNPKNIINKYEKEFSNIATWEILYLSGERKQSEICKQL